LSLLLIN